MPGAPGDTGQSDNPGPHGPGEPTALAAASSGLLTPTNGGLFCAAGGFHVDPWRPVERAVITHAHGDHCSWGCGSYLTSHEGRHVLRARVGEAAAIETLQYGERRRIGDVIVSLHPAGHILGSSQVRIEHVDAAKRLPRTVVSGDYKVSHEAGFGGGGTPFEPVPCDLFISESTFGLPIYRWRPDAEIFAEINEWWRANQRQGRTSIILAYALGKAQRVLAGVDSSIGPIAVHGAVTRLNDAYCATGVRLPTCLRASQPEGNEVRGQGLVVAPPSTVGSTWIRRFSRAPAQGMSIAMVSGWMAVRGTRRRRPVDRGFILSDHADWLGLLTAIRATGAQRVGVTHGYIAPLVRWLQESGLEAFGVPTRYEGETREDEQPLDEMEKETNTDSSEAQPVSDDAGGTTGETTRAEPADESEAQDA